MVHLRPTATPFTRAADLLAGDSRVQIAYAFGSRARGEARPDSDFDLAVLLDREPDLRELLRLRARIVAALESDAVDLVVLNRAPPLLCYEVISTGVRLLARDPVAADAFERRAFLVYCDTAHLRRVQRRLARQALVV